MIAAPAPIELSRRRVQGRLASSICYAALLAWTVAAAYPGVFSAYYGFDDEGFFEQAFRLFNQGHALYDSVFAWFGPFPYELWRAVFGLLGHQLTPDAGRLVQMTLWVGSALLLGLAAHRLTGRLSLGLIVQALSFNVLDVMTREPMHPGSLIVLLISALLLAATFVARRPRAALIAIGAIAAAVLLTKINAGGFLVVAIAFAVVCSSRLGDRRILRALSGIAFVAVGPAVMVGDLSSAWAQNFALLSACSAGAVVLMSRPVDGASGDQLSGLAEEQRWIPSLLIGFGAMAIVCVGGVLALGTSPSAMAHSMIGVASRQRNIFAGPLYLNTYAVLLAPIALAAAWGVRRRPPAASPSAPGAILRLAVGALILSSAVSGVLGLNVGAPFALGMLLAWVALVPTPEVRLDQAARFVRLLVVSAAVTAPLIAYPVPGTQVQYGGVFLLLCGALCAADGWSELSLLAARGAQAPPLGIGGVAGLCVALALAVQYVERPREVLQGAHQNAAALPFAGATRIHLPEADAQTLEQLVTAVRANCSTLLTLPGMMSLNIWSGVPEPSLMMAENWWAAIPPNWLKKTYADVVRAPRLCLVRNDSVVQFWQAGRSLPDIPLIRYLNQQFTPRARFGDYQFSVRSA